MLRGEKLIAVVCELKIARDKIGDASEKFGRRPEIDALDDLMQALISVARGIEALRESQGLSYTQIFNRSHGFRRGIPLWLEALKADPSRKSPPGE